MRSISRQSIETLKLFNHIRDERDNVSLLDHSMIMRHFHILKNNQRAFFLSEYVEGVELYDVIR